MLDEVAAVAFPGNYHARVDPLAGLDLPDCGAGAIGRMVHWASDGVAVLVDAPPSGCTLLAPGLASGCPATLSLERAALIDAGYVTDPDPRPAPPPDPNAVRAEPPHGHLRMRLQRLADTADGPLPTVDRRPVILHITHAWGGGVWQWIEDLIDGDPEHVHLVLSAVSESSGRRCGVRLKLCATGPDTGVLRELDLRPAIESVEIEHAVYRDRLSQLIERFGVSRLIVSSLIGHSLECLQTGLPTLVMLHDFFPLWPLLDKDPMPELERQDGDPDAARAAGLDRYAGAMRFYPDDAEFWNRVAAAWCVRVQGAGVHLAAPARHVIDRVRALSRIHELPIACVGHGFRPFVDSSEAQREPAAPDRPLHLVIPGRLTEGKGLALLKCALPQLGPVRLTALGCGRSGLKLMGRAGIDLIPDYRREELPGLIASLQPHAALLLSTVPETWSYTLSEMRALGLAPIATRVGAFVERIEDGRDGVLFEPTVDALIEVIEAWRQQPQGLSELAARAPAERTLEQMAADINALLASESLPNATRKLRFATPEQINASWQSARLADALARARAVDAERAQLASELERRSRWAETMERQFRDRSAWAERLESERVRQDRQLAEQAELIELRRREFEERSAWAEQLEAERRRQDRSLAEQAAELERQDRQYQALSERYGELIDDYGRRQTEVEQTRVALLRLVDRHVRLADRVRRTTAKLDRLSEQFEQLNRQHESLADQHQLMVEKYQALQTEYDDMIASRSWRWTKPFRFVRRVATPRRLRQGLNPLQWVRMTGVFVHHLRLRGLRDTLELLQTPAHEESAPDRQAAEVDVPDEIAPPVEFERTDEPLVSIIVPVHNQLKFTAACLQSLAAVRAQAAFEVIVVDDASTDETWKWLRRCGNVGALRNRKNRGFIGSCNRGAARARGHYLVFLNNDTQVTDHWLDRLIEPFEAKADVGIVGAKLVFGDGRLQEAGGIMFDDASGWNYGRGDDPGRPEFCFVSEADYVSGACLAIERAVFESLDGFDRHFAPAYYEDTDLCFRVRRRGLRVLYQPASRVIHFEGVTSGTDEASGAKRYQVVNRERFYERWRETLSDHPPNPGAFSGDLARRCRYRRFARRALVIDAVTPAPDQDSGSVRMFAMLELLSGMGFQTSFMPANLHWTGANSEALQQAGIEVLTAPWISRAEDWLEQHGSDLDLIVVSRHYVLSPMLPMIRRLCPGAKLVFDTVDLHFLREQREAELTGSQAAARAAGKTRREELALIEAADATLVVSEFERELLADLAPEARVCVVSNIHSLKDPGKPFAQRADLVFVGGFQHPPNLDAAEWLIDEILPAVHRSLPDVQLHIIGSKMPDALRRRRDKGLRIHGFVRDLAPFMAACRVSVAPLRYGAGVKGKVNQAMSHGLPVVATSCAAEGMYTEHGRDVLLADDTEALARQIVAVYEDRELWERLATNGRANVERHFSVKAARSAMLDLLADLELSIEDESACAEAAEA
jgi:GT2 family glycosyltransferase